MIPHLFANIPVISAPVWSLVSQCLTDIDIVVMSLLQNMARIFLLLANSQSLSLPLYVSCIPVCPLIGQGTFQILTCTQIGNKVLHLYTTLQLLLLSWWDFIFACLASGMELPDGITRRAIGSPLILPMLQLDGLEGKDWKLLCLL